jgi:hypothetical protein
MTFSKSGNKNGGKPLHELGEDACRFFLFFWIFNRGRIKVPSFQIIMTFRGSAAQAK